MEKSQSAATAWQEKFISSSDKKKVQRNKDMAQIYIAFVDTPGFFAGMIRQVIKQKYIHVVLSMDAELEEAYSVGRRNPAVPLFAGFEKEDKRKILTVFPTADYMVCSIECSLAQKEAIRQELRLAMQERFHYHYAVAGLPLFCGTFHFTRKTITPVLPTWHGY